MSRVTSIGGVDMMGDIGAPPGTRERSLAVRHYLADKLAKNEIDLITFRGLISEVCDCRGWEQIDNLGTNPLRPFRSLREFVTARRNCNGLGTTVEMIQRILGDSEERVVFEQAIGRGPGGANNPEGLGGKSGKKPEEIVNDGNANIVKEEPPRKRDSNNDVGYAIRRLTRDRPDLLEKVKTGDLSANAAMVEAGFRKVLSIQDQIKRLWSKLAIEDQQPLLAELERIMKGGHSS